MMKVFSLSMMSLSSLVLILGFQSQAQALSEETSEETETTTTTTTDTTEYPDTTESATTINESQTLPTSGELRAEAPAPKREKIVYINPVFGGASYEGNENADLESLDNGYSTGVLFTIGRTLSLETGLMFTSTDIANQRTGGETNIDYWGIPINAKVNFSGKPQETVFAKAGFTPITADSPTADTFDETDLMGQVGIGGALPLGGDAALTVEANYNQLLTREGIETEYSGYQVLAGVSWGL